MTLQQSKTHENLNHALAGESRATGVTFTSRAAPISRDTPRSATRSATPHLGSRSQTDSVSATRRAAATL
jgi:hypothetical protein